MSSPEIIEYAKSLGVTPEAFAAKVDIVMATGQSLAEAIATAYLQFAAPGFNAYAEICFDSEQAEEDGACKLDADIPAPWEPTEPEEMYAQSVMNRRLEDSGRKRTPKSAKDKQPSRVRSQRGPSDDDKESA